MEACRDGIIGPVYGMGACGCQAKLALQKDLTAAPFDTDPFNKRVPLEVILLQGYTSHACTLIQRLQDVVCVTAGDSPAASTGAWHWGNRHIVGCYNFLGLLC